MQGNQQLPISDIQIWDFRCLWFFVSALKIIKIFHSGLLNTVDWNTMFSLWAQYPRFYRKSCDRAVRSVTERNRDIHPRRSIVTAAVWDLKQFSRWFRQNQVISFLSVDWCDENFEVDHKPENRQIPIKIYEIKRTSYQTLVKYITNMDQYKQLVTNQITSTLVNREGAKYFRG